jgi:hypothetical protein
MPRLRVLLALIVPLQDQLNVHCVRLESIQLQLEPSLISVHHVVLESMQHKLELGTVHHVVMDHFLFNVILVTVNHVKKHL